MKNILALALILSLAFTSLAQQPGFQLSPVTPYGNPSVEPSLWYHLGDDSQGSYIMHKASTNTQQVEIDVLNTDKSFYKRLQIKFFKNKKGLLNDTLFAKNGKIYASFKEPNTEGLMHRLIAIYDREGNLLQEKEISFNAPISFFYMTPVNDTLRTLAIYMLNSKKKNFYVNHYTSNLDLIDSSHLAFKPGGRIMTLRLFDDEALVMMESTCCRINLQNATVQYTETEVIDNCTFSYLNITRNDTAYVLSCLYTFESSEKKTPLNYDGFITCTFNRTDLAIRYQHKHPFSEQSRKMALNKQYQLLKGIANLYTCKVYPKDNGNIILTSLLYQPNGILEGAMMMEISRSGEMVWNSFLMYVSSTGIRPIFIQESNLFYVVVPEHAKNIKYQNLSELHNVEPVTPTTIQGWVTYAVNENGRIKQTSLYTQKETDLVEPKVHTTWVQNGQVFLLLGKGKNTYQRLSTFPANLSNRITF